MIGHKVSSFEEAKNTVMGAVAQMGDFIEVSCEPEAIVIYFHDNRTELTISADCRIETNFNVTEVMAKDIAQELIHRGKAVGCYHDDEQIIPRDSNVSYALVDRDTPNVIEFYAWRDEHDIVLARLQYGDRVRKCEIDNETL